MSFTFVLSALGPVPLLPVSPAWICQSKWSREVWIIPHIAFAEFSKSHVNSESMTGTDVWIVDKSERQKN